MKTHFIIVLLFLPIVAFNQGTPDSNAYQVLEKGEEWIFNESTDSAIVFSKKMLSNKHSSISDRSQAYFVLGKAYFEDELPEIALNNFNSCILLAQKIKDERLTLRALVAISACMGDKFPPEIDSSILYATKAQDLAIKLQDTLSLAKIYSNLVNIYNSKEDYKKSIEYSNLFDAILNSIEGREKERGVNLYARGNTLMQLYLLENNRNYLEDSRKSFENAIRLYQKSNKPRYEAHARNALADCLLYFEDLPQAEQEAKLSISLAESISDTLAAIDGYYTLANVYEMSLETKKLIRVLEKLKGLLEGNNHLSDEETEEIDQQFAREKARKSLPYLTSRIEVGKGKLENEQNILIGSIIIFLLSVFSLGFYLKTRRQKKLFQEKLKLLTQSREIEYFKARLEGEEEGRHRIAQRIHDGVGGLFISTKWNLESALDELPQAENKIAQRLKENLRLQEHSYLELRRVMYELEKSDLPWWEQLDQFCQQMSKNQKTNIDFYTYNLEELDTEPIGEEIRFIVQELVTNALKHAKATQIDVQICLIEKELDIIVEDNGQGYDPNTVTKGIGSKSMEARVSKLGGSLSLETGKGKGTISFVHIPVQNLSPMERKANVYPSVN